jgi:hypothetical protein
MLPSPTDDGKATAALDVHARYPMPRSQALFLVTTFAYEETMTDSRDLDGDHVLTANRSCLFGIGVGSACDGGDRS